MTAKTRMTVGELAAQRPAATQVLEGHGIDFCCGGARPFDEACREIRLDPQAVLDEIEAAGREGAAPPDARDWTREALDALIDHIVNRHHTYLREELPRLATWLSAVQKAHGHQDGAKLAELGSVLSGLADELMMHLRKEETILFPAIRRSDGWIAQPIALMEHEHDTAGRALAELRRLTRGFQPPAHACATYRALYAGLAALEKDLHQHIHLENNILFPRAQADVERGRGC